MAALGAALALSGSCAEGGHTYIGVDRKVRAVSAAAPRAALAVAASSQSPSALAPEQINAQRPFSDDPIRPMRPFVLKAAAADGARALDCLTQAIYYEAGGEPLQGQQAVAQVVLNRVRHPAYPKSVCAVVFQGSARATGCQFTFTCDGALRFRPEPAVWERARAVARRALAGYVDAEVGSATHYHAAYVAPAWAPTLVKMTQVGRHIFYRWTGTWGEPAAFTGRYAGHEAELTTAVLQAQDPAPPTREVVLTVDGQSQTYKVAVAGAAVGSGPARGVIQPTRRRATPEEIKRINERLASFEAGLDVPASAETPAG